MEHTGFRIGLEFLGPAGFRWRCTDVGTRTIVAVRLDRDNDPNWYRGPPYVAEEVVFDEHEIGRCHLTLEEALLAAIEEAETSGHPGYPSDVVDEMMRARFEDADARYPHEGVLRLERAHAVADGVASPRCRLNPEGHARPAPARWGPVCPRSTMSR